MPLDKLDPTDFFIIRCLNEDARTPMSRIAAELGIPESTIRHRLNKLLADHVIEFAVLANPFRYSSVCAHFEIYCDVARVGEVANSVSASRKIYYVGVMLGPYQIMATGFFESNQQLSEFVSGTLSLVPGIRDIRTYLVANVVKRELSFDFMNGGLESSRPETRAAALAASNQGKGTGTRSARGKARNKPVVEDINAGRSRKRAANR